VNTPYSL